MSPSFNTHDGIDFPHWHKLHRSKNGGSVGLLMLSVAALSTWAVYMFKDQMENPSIVVELSPDAPILATENHYIYKFLNGDITNQDTPWSLWEKVKQRVQSLVSEVTMYDDFIFDIEREILYRRENKIPESPLLIAALEQVKCEADAINHLSILFEMLNPGDTSTMNSFILDYYNTTGGKSFIKEQLKEWKEKIEQERRKYGYAYADF